MRSADEYLGTSSTLPMTNKQGRVTLTWDRRRQASAVLPCWDFINMCLSAKLFLVFLMTVHGALSSTVHYIAPDDCEWTAINQSATSDVVLTCHLQYIRRGAQATNFSLIQSQHTASLNIFCDQVFFESHLGNGSFSHLRHTRGLVFEHCKFPDIPDNAFVGLKDLRNLTLRTHNQDWKDLPLQLGPRSLSPLSRLENLDLGYNNIFQLPEFIFCGLENLKTLNLTFNSFLDAGLIGLNSLTEDRKSCLQELQELDLSRNKIKHIKRGEFLRLHNLQVLYMHRNDLLEVSEAALEGLRRLQFLDLSMNKLPAIPTHFFHSTPDIRQLRLQNNSISKLPSGVFRGLQQLVILDLSRNAISSGSVSSETFADLIRLVVLDLSFNYLQSINVTTFQSQYSLQILYLQNNRINTIADNAFASLYNLHTLILTGNNLKQLESFTLNGLYVLSYLALDANELDSIHADAFKNCSSVQNLILSDNRLSSIPKAITALQFLKSLHLHRNHVEKLTNISFQGLKQLQHLNLSMNRIGNLSRGTFRDLPSLKHLNLSHNRIQVLEHGVFDDAADLTNIALNDNLLTDINGLFMNLRALQLLNISRNQITWFDYALIPIELQRLDLHDNQIEVLGNYFELEPALHLRWIDASFNRLKEINGASFPNKIEFIQLNSNTIRVINAFSFMAKINLTHVDMRNNLLQNLDINSFRLKQFPNSKALPDFYISGNPYVCDCTMEWLQRINNLDETRQYPRIVDLDKVMCNLPYSRRQPVIPLPLANSSDFLCKYKSHCFALCHCCEFDACDCEMVCPENCTCYYDQTWNTNIVDCSRLDVTVLPNRVPMDVTELYLDGNDLPHLTSHAFIGRKNMKVLYLNNSKIVQMNNRTFNGLQLLQVLHLEHNKLTVLHGNEFENLSHLRELYLSHNRIHSIHNMTFVSLRSLEILHIDHNLVIEFQVWNLNTNSRLFDVTLGNNPWTCNCQFMEDYQDWLQVFGTYVRDFRDIRCHYNKSVGPFLLEFNSSACINITSITYFQAVFTDDFMRLMIVVPCILVVVLFFLVLVCIYRKEMKVWVYSKYGVRIFHKTNYTPESEKLFDAFVSYCKKDEAFVAQILAPEMECGEPPYRLCLRYRDLPMAGYVAEAIQEAIECSHRTLFVLSEQFFKSEWCLFELKTAYHEAQCNKRHRLIVIVLDRISFKDLDPDSRLCLRSSTLIHWGDRRFWEKLRYSMPEGRTQKGRDITATPVKRSAQSNSVKLV